MKKTNLLAMFFVAGALLTSCNSEEKKEEGKKELSKELTDAIKDVSDKGKATSDEVLLFIATFQNQVDTWKAERKIDDLKAAVAGNAKISEQAAPMLEAADKAVADVDALLAEIIEAGKQSNVKGDEFREWAKAATSGKIKEDALKGQIEEWNNVVSEMSNNLATWKAKWQEIADADKANIDALNALVAPAK